MKKILFIVISFSMLFTAFPTLAPSQVIFESEKDKEEEKAEELVEKYKEKKSEEKLDQNLIDQFYELTNEEQKAFFLSLNDEEKEEIFKTISTEEKITLFQGLNEREKDKWLRRYPGIEFFIIPEEGPSPLHEKKEQYVEEESSYIEKLMSGDFPSDISRDLKQFGYNFFTKAGSSFSAASNAPVGEDYVIGPGDSFVINLWGRAEMIHKVIVDRDGMITVPRVGSMAVTGLSFSGLKKYLYRKFKEYYPDFQLSITMDRLRSIDVFIVGEVELPGTYSVNALSTVITALSDAGGPTKNGTLRKIKLQRNGNTPQLIDLYDFFISGDKSNDIRLQPGDTIFVPVIGAVAGIAGNVKRPAIYELKDGESAADLIAMAGGILPTGQLQNIVIERMEGNKRRVIKSFDFDKSEKTPEYGQVPLKEGDLVKIYPIHDAVHKVVYLEGHVKYPMEYEFKSGMKLLDLIPTYDSLLPEPYLGQAEIIRLSPPDEQPEIVSFNLGKLLDGDEAHNLALQERDKIIIYGNWEKMDKPKVSIQGEVRNPGSYYLYKGMRIKDLVFQAGNLTEKAYKKSADIMRLVQLDDNTETLQLSFSLEKAINSEEKDNKVLQPNDTIYIRAIPRFNDSLERKIILEGEFRFPGEYSYLEGERLYSVIQRAGGLSKEGYARGAVFQREDVKRVQKGRLREYIDRLEEDILTIPSVETTDKEEAALQQQTLASKKELLEKMKNSEPTGRMVIDLAEVLVFASSDFNFELRAGDKLIVPKRPDFITIMGEVYNPTALFAEKGKTVDYYLNRVGGITDGGDDDEIYIVKVDGSVLSKRQEGFFGFGSWDTNNNRWSLGSFESIILEAGDTIIVPKEVDKYNWLKAVTTGIDLVFKTATAAGVLINLID